MGRGKNVQSIEDFLKEPYVSIIELLLETKNPVFLLRELRYLLLDDHELGMVARGTTKGEEMISKKLFFRDGEKSFRTVRSMLQQEGRMLRNTTGKNKGRPMNTNGLNKLLQTMMKGHGPNVLMRVGDGYQLVGEPFHQFVRAEREKRISSCPDGNTSELKHGVSIYNLPLNKKLLRQLNRNRELYEGLRQAQDEVMKLWAKRKVSLFLGRLKRLSSLHRHGNFLGYCSEMVRWFIRTLDLDEADFKKEQEGILKIAKGKRARAEARKYGKNISACKEALKKTRASIATLGSRAEGAEFGGLSDIVEVSLLSVPGILSAEEDVAVDRVIHAMIDNGMIGSVEGDLLLLDQEMSALFRERRLDECLSSAAFEEEPIIVIDFR